MSGTGPFAVWITGLPASGKSSITRELVVKLDALGVRPVVLESDEMRKILTPEPAYGDEERDRFYRSLVLIGAIIAKNNVPVIFDATANKRRYRDEARSRLPRFVEVYVQCPIDVCIGRDPKGIYASASAGAAFNVPGVQARYEEPAHPDVIADCRASAEENAALIIGKLRALKFL